MPIVSLHTSQASQFSYGLHSSASQKAKPADELEKQNQQLVESKIQAEQSTKAHSIQSYSSFSQRVEGVDAYQAVANTTETNPYAQNILNAIQNQLAIDESEGASQGELQSRLEAGLEGFLTGFDQAMEELDSVLTDEVRAEIEGTKTQVLAGLASLAEEYGLNFEDAEAASQDEAEVISEEQTQALGQSAASGFSNILNNNQNLELGYGVGQMRDFSFALETADGDLIEIHAKAMKVGASHLEYGAGGASVGVAGAQQSSFAFSVNGELDEDELKAINDLLGQVNKITDTFFNGDAEDAFNMALNVGYDSDEIAQFALNIQRTDVERVVSSYGQVANQGQENSPVKPQMGHKMAALGDLIRDLQEAHHQAHKMGQDKDFVTQLTEQVSRLRYEDESKSVSLTRMMNAFSA